MKIKKGDNVKITVGKDRGKTGTVSRVLSVEGRVVIDGLNLYKKRSKPKKQGKKGEMVLVPRPLQVSNIQLVCGNCKQPTRVGYHFEGEKKVRYCKKCQSPLN
ncbi:MAG: 50S ribosomal protein L24 [Patescibacteria group bacterium]